MDKIEKSLENITKTLDDLETITEEDLLKACNYVKELSKGRRFQNEWIEDDEFGEDDWRQKRLHREDRKDEDDEDEDKDLDEKMDQYAENYSDEKAEKAMVAEVIDHDGERDRFGHIVKSGYPYVSEDPRDEMPEWLHNVNTLGMDYDPREESLGRKFEMENHTNNPAEADQLVHENLDEYPSYYSELVKLTNEIQQLADDLDRPIDLNKAMELAMDPNSVHPPKGMRWNSEYNCLESVPEEELKKDEAKEKLQKVEAIEKNFRKSLGLGNRRFTKQNLVKMVTGESSHRIYSPENDELLKADSTEHAERIVGLVLENESEEPSLFVEKLED